MKQRKKLFARELRKNQTYTETIMWKLLRNRRFHKYKFRRQHVIGRFIVDFYCHSNKLIVEVDGPIHNKQKAYDKAREEIIKAKGYSIIRFKASEVEESLSDVCQKLERALFLTLSPGEREAKPSTTVKL